VSTIVYIDGFNFYYSAVKGTTNKWIDFEALSRRLVPRDEIVKIKYFTAPIKGRGGTDPRAHDRQAAFLRAVQTNPLIEVHQGHFRTDPVWLPLAPGPWANATRPRIRPRRWIDGLQARFEPRLGRRPSVLVLKTEEKGSDVNLASHLLHDAFKAICTKALVISNDSDLAAPIAMAVAEGVTVGVVNPDQPRKKSRHLREVASFDLQLRHSILSDCQMGNPVFNHRGRQIHKPREWR
jgi:uncharacterized LabA/DUF88 family protein